MSEKVMDKHIRSFLNRAALISSSIASLILLLLYLRTPETCIRNHHHHRRLGFPRSTCDHRHREFLSADHKNHRLCSTAAWHNKVSSLAHLFSSVRDLGLLSNDSHVLCVAAEAGHDVAALRGIHVAEAVGVDLLDSPPLVHLTDPHNLPFFDGAFDLSFSAHLADALFPSRFAAEMERVVARGGTCVVVVVDEDFEEADVREVVRLFTRSQLVQAKKGSLIGSKVTRIIMKRI